MENLSETDQEVKSLLEAKVEEFDSKSFIKSDPIQIPHQFSDARDQEVIGLLIATIAWGNRKMIIDNGKRLIDLMNGAPYDFVMNYSTDQLAEKHFVHRTFNRTDLDFFLRGLQNIYQSLGSLERAFAPHPSMQGVGGRIVSFREHMFDTIHESRSEKHISNPLKNSAAKRINMFLRWMVRKDQQGVDFGIWNSIDPAELMLPLDVHTGRVARKLGLFQRKQNDWKALEELMERLRQFDPSDPVKYDYALFGLGVFDDFGKN